MAIFGRRGNGSSGPMTDQEWLAAGHRRFERDHQRFFGSPESMRWGGQEALDNGDPAAALFFFAKAIDIAQTWSFSRPGERPPHLDVSLFDVYVDTLGHIASAHPEADLLSDWNNESGERTADMMVSVAKRAHQTGHPTARLDAAVNRYLEVTGTTPPDHW